MGFQANTLPGRKDTGPKQIAERTGSVSLPAGKQPCLFRGEGVLAFHFFPKSLASWPLGQSVDMKKEAKGVCVGISAPLYPASAEKAAYSSSEFRRVRSSS